MQAAAAAAPSAGEAEPRPTGAASTGTARIRTEDVVNAETLGCSFKQLYLKPHIEQGLLDAGFVHPTPIQLRAIPIGNLGADMIVQSKAGTGKTLIFTVVALHHIDTASSLPQCIILSATREIAQQITQVVRQVGRHCDGLSCQTFIGGVTKGDDRASLKRCQVVVGSAGRVKDLLCDAGMMHASKVKLLVLDEVDALLGGPDTLAMVNSIFRELPERKQVCTFSATYTDSLTEILRTYMRSPQVVSLREAGDQTTSLRGVSEYYLLLPGDEKGGAAARGAAVARVLDAVPFTQCIVFSNSQPAAERLARELCEKGFAADIISARLEQSDRSAVIRRFADFNVRVLISSDLTARGIDMTKVNLVISIDLPQHGETYLHRIGRTGRYGSVGIALSVVTPAELVRLRELRKGVRSDGALQEFPSDPSALAGGDHMVGVLETEEERARFERHEQSRAAGVALPPPRRVAGGGKGGGKSGKDAGTKGAKSGRKGAAPPRPASPAPAAKRPRGGSPAAAPAAAAPAAPPAAAAASPGGAQLQYGVPWGGAQSAAQHAPRGRLDAAAGRTPPRSTLAEAAPSASEDVPAYVAELWQRLCAHSDQYYRAYYEVAFNCISQAHQLHGGAAAWHVPQTPPPPVHPPPP